MADDKRASTEDKASLFSILVTLPFYLLFTLLISALVSAIVEWCGIYFEWWDQPGIKHSQFMLSQELGFLNVRLNDNYLSLVSGITIKDAFDNSVGYIVSLLHDVGFTSIGSDTSFGVYLGAAVNMVILTLVRFFVFLFSLIMFLFFGLVGFTIGVFERDKRRAGGGRESGAIFNLSKACITPSLGLAAFLYIAWPDSIDPVYIIFPFASVFGVAIAYTTASYKKYI